MFRPIRDRPGLIAAFAAGGQFEDNAGVLGRAGAGVRPDRFGILPYDFLIPKGLFPIIVDGQVHLGTEYLGAEEVLLRYQDGNQATDALVHLVYRDEPADQNLYIGVTNLRDVAGDRRADSWIAISIDADFSRSDLALWNDFQIRAPLSGEPATFWLGDGQGAFVRINEIRPGPNGLFDVAYDYLDEFGPPNMEFRLSRSLLGDWTEIDGMTIDKVFAAIEEDLRNQYSLGYTPQGTGNREGYHKIRLTTRQKGLTVQTREGYYSS